jgi:hypothetical protein
MTDERIAKIIDLAVERLKRRPAPIDLPPVAA